MADNGAMKARTLKHKNIKALTLAAPAPRLAQPSESDRHLNGVDSELQIGIEYKLDLKREDLEVLKDLGHGNGGTVSKVRHTATNTIMARKVWICSYQSMPQLHLWQVLISLILRSSTSRQTRKCANGSFENSRSCTIPIPSSLSISMVHF